MTVSATVIKLGGSILTDKARPDSFQAAVAGRIARELKGAVAVVLVHGTGAYGKPLAHAWGYPSGRIAPGQALLWARIRGHLAILHQQVLEALLAAEVPAVSVPLGPTVRCTDGRITEGDALLAAVRRVQAAGAVPVLMGDVAPETAGGYAVCSSDEICRYVGLGLPAARALFLTDVDGVYAQWPPAPGSNPLPVIGTGTALPAGAAGTDPADVSRSMTGKLGAAVPLAEAGIPCSIHNGLRPGVLADLLSGRPAPGTLVAADPGIRRDQNASVR